METKQVECPYCQAEGYILVMGTGAFSSHSETYEPDESFALCQKCKGEGTQEVCAICLEPFHIIKGLEACACTRLHLPKAA